MHVPTRNTFPAVQLDRELRADRLPGETREERRARLDAARDMAQEPWL